jgi:pyruvate dehydrogenase E2 component (dihydrolipoamide acetyltransferase)
VAIEFKLPELGENIESGDLVRVIVSPGAQVHEGDPVIELETDKAVIEVPSTISGTIGEIKVKQGDKVKVGQVIFTLAEGKAADAKATPPAEAESAAAPAQTAATPIISQARPKPVDTGGAAKDFETQEAARDSYARARELEGKSEEEAFPPDVHREEPQPVVPAQLTKTAGPEHRPPLPASPAVRRLARELGVDIYNVRGSGASGRILEDDVKAYAKSMISSAGAAIAGAAMGSGFVRPAPQLPDFSKWGPIEKVSMRAVRRKTAEHLAEAWNTVPHVTQHDLADITEVEELRKRFAAKAEVAGGKMTITAIALKVAASALKVFPQFNASIDVRGEEVIYKRYIHIGVAVDTDRGLLVPVIRDVDRKNIVELAVELAQISLKARNKKLTPEDMEGGTFTITNLGGVGGSYFTPIVNHPEVAILGMSRSRIEPVWDKDKEKFEPRLMLPVSLSYDHRLIDGADAARFVRWFVEALEQPFLLSVQG